jgi:hypothetical protein
MDPSCTSIRALLGSLGLTAGLGVAACGGKVGSDGGSSGTGVTAGATAGSPEFLGNGGSAIASGVTAGSPEFLGNGGSAIASGVTAGATTGYSPAIFGNAGTTSGGVGDLEGAQIEAGIEVFDDASTDATASNDAAAVSTQEASSGGNASDAMSDAGVE